MPTPSMYSVEVNASGINPLNGLRQAVPKIEYLRLITATKLDRNCLATGREYGRVWEYSSRVPTYLSSACLPNERIMRNTRLYGVELEVERRAKTSVGIVNKVWESLNEFCIVKSDGSLRNGFEIVSVPATLGAHRIGWAKFFGDKTNPGPASELSSFRMRSCGMHVHVNKVSIDMTTLRRFVTLINKKDHDQYLSRIAGRPVVGSDSILYKTRMKLPDGKARVVERAHTNYAVTKQISFKEHLLNSEHRDAVNLSNPNTIEVRIFRGNTAKTGFFKNLEFVDAALKFCSVCSDRDLNGANFLDWVSAREVRREYPAFMEWLSFHKVHLLGSLKKGS